MFVSKQVFTVMLVSLVSTFMLTQMVMFNGIHKIRSTGSGPTVYSTDDIRRVSI